MSRISSLIDRIEKLAKKFGMSIEEVIDILEGKHPDHCVTARPPVVTPVVQPVVPGDVGNGAGAAADTLLQSGALATSAGTALATGTADVGNGAGAGSAADVAPGASSEPVSIVQGEPAIQG